MYSQILDCNELGVSLEAEVTDKVTGGLVSCGLCCRYYCGGKWSPEEPCADLLQGQDSRFLDQAQANIACTVARIAVHARSGHVLATICSIETVDLLHLGSYFDAFSLGREISINW
jgi:hypothetical protein